MHCPDCDEPLVSTFESIGGLSGQKRGDAYNTAPDTQHYICFSCAKAWKQRLDGRLTPDVLGELAFFTCPVVECGMTLAVTGSEGGIEAVRLACSKGHVYEVARDAEGLRLRTAPAGQAPAGAD
jgi:hypothetical protein